MNGQKLSPFSPANYLFIAFATANRLGRSDKFHLKLSVGKSLSVCKDIGWVCIEIQNVYDGSISVEQYLDFGPNVNQPNELAKQKLAMGQQMSLGGLSKACRLVGFGQAPLGQL